MSKILWFSSLLEGNLPLLEGNLPSSKDENHSILLNQALGQKANLPDVIKYAGFFLKDPLTAIKDMKCKICVHFCKQYWLEVNKHRIEMLFQSLCKIDTTKTSYECMMYLYENVSGVPDTV